MSKVTSPVDGA